MNVRFLDRVGCTTSGAAVARAGITLLENEPFDAVLVDCADLDPALTGWLRARANSLNASTPVIFVIDAEAGPSPGIAELADAVMQWPYYSHDLVYALMQVADSDAAARLTDGLARLRQR